MTIDPTENPKIDHRIREFLQVLNSRDGKPIETLTPEEVSKIVVKPQNPTSWTKLMKTHYYLSLVTKALTGAMLIACTVVQAEAADDVKVTELMTKDLMNVPGKEGTMITVDYPPGGADPVHRHNASAFVYVLEGSIVMQMKGGKEVTLHAGETFYEDPEGVHLVGKNASDTKPAKFVVFLVKDKGAPILIPVNE